MDLYLIFILMGINSMVVSDVRAIVNRPPTFMQMSPREVIFEKGQESGVTLHCDVSSYPPPSYRWELDGQPLELGGPHFQHYEDTGSIIINDPQEEDEGIYQCFASTEFGTALSVKTQLRMAVLEYFEPKETVTHHTQIGKPLRLACSPPYSYPAPGMIWAIISYDFGMRFIETDNRVTMDYDGNLYFSNIMEADFSDENGLSCVVWNDFLRQTVTSEKTTIQQMQGTPSIPSYAAPTIEWNSDLSPVGLRNEVVRMKCIFSGYPTPTVTWHRLDVDGSELALPEGVEFPYSSANMELELRNLQFEDRGIYECRASNQDGGSTASRSFNVTVQAKPFFIKKPRDLMKPQEGTAVFQCKAGGNPRPLILWSVNGVPIEDLPPNPRRTVTEASVIYRNIASEDEQVLQCNATNKHGYVFSNAYLSVMAEPPSFIKVPPPVTKTAVSLDVTIPCEVFGAPTPEIQWKRWQRDSRGYYTLEQVPGPPRFLQNQTGLTIIDVSKEDAGQYECMGHNRLGEINADGFLIVRDRTVIIGPPQDATVDVSDNVVFHCGATTDPVEEQHLRIDWMKNGEMIDFQSEPRMAMNLRDGWLFILAAQEDDSAMYTCVASNGLDEDTAEAILTVTGTTDQSSASN